MSMSKGRGRERERERERERIPSSFHAVNADPYSWLDSGIPKAVT